jgi:hypothetical protein
LDQILDGALKHKKVLIMGDFNGDLTRGEKMPNYNKIENIDTWLRMSMVRKKQPIDGLLKRWIAKRRLIALSYLYTQYMNYTFMDSRGRGSKFFLISTNSPLNLFLSLTITQS